MDVMLNKEDAITLLKQYNKEPFHLFHGLTVGGVMHWYAKKLGYSSETDFWENVGLLHDIDYEIYPQEHCIKAAEILKEAGANEAFIHAICSHGYQIVSDVKPEHTMEKVLFAVDELTGLISAAAKMRPSKSVSDMEVSSLKKKFKDKSFAAGCSRDIIKRGAEQLEWDINQLFEFTILAMRSCEEEINTRMQQL